MVPPLSPNLTGKHSRENNSSHEVERSSRSKSSFNINKTINLIPGQNTETNTPAHNSPRNSVDTKRHPPAGSKKVPMKLELDSNRERMNTEQSSPKSKTSKKMVLSHFAGSTKNLPKVDTNGS